MASGGGGCWSSLPAHLLRRISGSMSEDTDQLHVRQVCTRWRTSTSPLAGCRPWIVAGRVPEPWHMLGPIGEHSFWLPRGGERINSGAPVGLPYCCGASRGWLALTDDDLSPKRFILWEPVSKAEILLPRLPAVANFFLSGDPLDSSDWMAIANSKSPRSPYQKLFFWRPGDADWTMLEVAPFSGIDSAAFHGGRFYFTDTLCFLHIYDLEASRPQHVQFTSLFPALAATGQLGKCAVHVVSCDGDLLLFVLRRDGPYPRPPNVYKPDWKRPELQLGEAVADLGEYSLFLGRGDGFALSAKEFPVIKRNCVYFVEHDIFTYVCWASVFDLESNASERILYPEWHRVKEDSCQSNHWFAYTWFCPRRPVWKE